MFVFSQVLWPVAAGRPDAAVHRRPRGVLASVRMVEAVTFWPEEERYAWSTTPAEDGAGRRRGRGRVRRRPCPAPGRRRLPRKRRGATNSGGASQPTCVSGRARGAGSPRRRRRRRAARGRRPREPRPPRRRRRRPGAGRLAARLRLLDLLRPVRPDDPVRGLGVRRRSATSAAARGGRAGAGCSPTWRSSSRSSERRSRSSAPARARRAAAASRRRRSAEAGGAEAGGADARAAVPVERRRRGRPRSAPRVSALPRAAPPRPRSRRAPALAEPLAVRARRRDRRRPRRDRPAARRDQGVRADGADPRRATGCRAPPPRRRSSTSRARSGARRERRLGRAADRAVRAREVQPARIDPEARGRDRGADGRPRRAAGGGVRRFARPAGPARSRRSVFAALLAVRPFGRELASTSTWSRSPRSCWPAPSRPSAAIAARRAARRFDEALRRRPPGRPRPAQLERTERAVTLGGANAFDFHARLRPLLREVAQRASRAPAASSSTRPPAAPRSARRRGSCSAPTASRPTTASPRASTAQRLRALVAMLETL